MPASEILLTNRTFEQPVVHVAKSNVAQ